MTTLKAALQEACFMELEEMPSEEILSEDEALTFSPAFERKMKKLIRRADHPIRYRIAQAAACGAVERLHRPGSQSGGAGGVCGMGAGIVGGLVCLPLFR